VIVRKACLLTVVADKAVQAELPRREAHAAFAVFVYPDETGSRQHFAPNQKKPVRPTIATEEDWAESALSASRGLI
jgi:hypothetical protein